MDENTKYGIKDYREMLYQQIKIKKKEVRNRWRQVYLQQFQKS